jgi:choline transport protein
MFQQATRSNGGTLALLVLFLIDTMLNLPGGYITAGRMLWTLARDDATPFSNWVRHISPTWRNPFNAQLVCGVCVTILGAIYVANATAFTAIIGGFTIFTTWSYCAAILPHILTGRKHLKPGPFWMPAAVTYTLGGIACAYIIVFNVIYMFPYVYPVDVTSMNYVCVMTGGSTLLLTFWYLWKRSHGYEGPKVALDGHDDILKGVVGLSALEEEKMRRRSTVPDLSV